MRAILADPELYEEASFEHEDETRHELRLCVNARRAADKLNHFIRWAESITHEVPIEQRIAAVRGHLPEGLIGEHAVSHLRDRDHFLSEDERKVRYAWWYRRPPRARVMDRGEMAQLLREVIATGGAHRLLHRYLLAVYQRNPSPGAGVVRPTSALPRTLAGVHDVRAWLREMSEASATQVYRGGRWVSQSGWTGWRKATECFLTKFKEVRGDVDRLAIELKLHPDPRAISI